MAGTLRSRVTEIWRMSPTPVTSSTRQISGMMSPAPPAARAS